MDINIPLAALVIVAALVLVGWLIKRNLKDEKEFEKSLNESESKPEMHEDEDH